MSRFSFLILLPLFLACSSENKDLSSDVWDIEELREDVESEYSPTPRLQDTIFSIEDKGFRSIEVRILPAEKPVGTILVLPGWNYPYSHWCDSTTLCKQATDAGFNLVLLTSGKTIYQQKIYPETRSDWKQERNLSWFTDEFLQYMSENFQVFEPGDRNTFILGLSTGARGAFLIGKERSDIFKAVAALSGDYDQSFLPDDNLYRGFYGNEVQFEERYTGLENPISNMAQLDIPVYLGHGLLDEIVSPQHSMHLQKVIYDSLPGADVKLHIDKDAQHNYRYWNSEVPNVMNFFYTYMQ